MDYQNNQGYRQMTVQDLPPQFKPLSPWAYFGYSLLFSIPVAGFVLLIVFACGGTGNINLRNWARSYFCVYLLIVAIVIVILLLTLAGIGTGVFGRWLDYIF